MKNILFTALLGCFIASGLAQHDAFQFTDSQGRCWSCSPNQPCVPCGHNMQPDPVIDHPITCPLPDCSVLENRPILFPIAGDPTGYWQCAPQGAAWEPVRVDCQCGTFFDFVAGNCQFIWDWQPHCLITGPLPDPISCEDDTTTAETTVETTTVLDSTTVATTTSQPCNPCMPCMPCMIWWMCSPCNNQCNNGCMG